MTITTFKKVWSKYGTRLSLTWEDFVSRLKLPQVTEEDAHQYAHMSNEEKTVVKDVGGYVGGTFSNNHRSHNDVEARCLVVIDADDYTELPSCLTNWEHQQIKYFVHTTHTHTKESPRLRWIFPLSRLVDGDEYIQVARVLASWVGGADKTTDQPERIMFWPSVSFDGEYRFWENPYDGEFLNPDTILDEYIPVVDEQIDSPEQSFLEPIPEGNRNKGVFAYAASLYSVGLTGDDLWHCLYSFNETRCDPPLPERELRTIFGSLKKYTPGEKLAALVNSMRTVTEDFSDIEGLKVLKAPKPAGLIGESCASLAGREIEAAPPIVEDILYEGCTILSAPPKTGKSYMCMDLGLSIATGTDFMGEHTRKGIVMYFALEDGDKRLKDRSAQVSGMRGAPEELVFYKVAPTLGGGLLDQVRAKKYELEKKLGLPVLLVIFDTFQLIRDDAKKNVGVYAHDYDEVHVLHDFGIDEHCAVLLVHHNNKGDDQDDYMNNISGSAGIGGAADAFIVIKRKRGEDKATMGISGRECPEHIFTICMNWGTFRWENLGEEKDTRAKEEELEYRRDPVVSYVRSRLDAAMDGEESAVTISYTVKEFIDDVRRTQGGSSPATDNGMRAKLSDLKEKFKKYDGIIQNYEDGIYSFKKEIVESS